MERRPDADVRERLELDAARSFQASWLIARFLAEEADAPGVATELSALFTDLGIQPESSLRDYLDRSDDGSRLMALLNEAGTQLKVNRPNLLPYFEAGWNIALALASNDGQRLESIAATIELPDGVPEPKDAPSSIAWANALASGFHQRIYGTG